MENWKNGQLIGTEPDPEPETEIRPVPPTIEERVSVVEDSNAELATTVDSILTEVIPSIMGI